MTNHTDALSPIATNRMRSIGNYALGTLVALGLGALAGWGAHWVLGPEFKSESTYAVVSNSASGAAGLGSLGGLASLSGLAGAGAGRLNLDQYVALIQNTDTLDAIIGHHGLLNLWHLDDQEKTQKKLKRALRIWIGQKDQLVRIEATMPTADLAAKISNELGQLMASKTSELASAEARSRRQALEPEVKRAQGALQAAQQHLVRTQLNPSLARADSRSLAELMGKLQAELGTVETRLAAATTALAANSAEMKQLVATRDSIRSRLDGMQKSSPSGDFGYMEAFREFKYQEAVLEILLRQYESARIDEVKGGQYIHVVQPARPAERPAFPDPLVLTATGALSAATLFGLTMLLWARKNIWLTR